MSSEAGVIFRPKVRQDESVRVAADTALRESGYRSVSRLCVDVFEDAVILTGVVPSFYMKQLAQEAVLKLDIVTRVENTVEVERR